MREPAAAGTALGARGLVMWMDQYDVIVAMNAAALKVDLPGLKQGGMIIANTQGFDKKNLGLAHYPPDVNPLEDGSLQNYIVHKIDITRQTKECLSGTGLGMTG